MINPLPIPDELWGKVPPDSQAAIAVAFQAMEPEQEVLGTMRAGRLRQRQPARRAASKDGRVSVPRGESAERDPGR